MARLAPRIEALRPLFAKSGNCCSFPDCNHILINEKNQFVAQVCHIEAAAPGGERYNPLSTDEYRRSYDNLILLCYSHHVETNDVNEYPVPKLREMKKKHESFHTSSGFVIDKKALLRIATDMQEYWAKIDRLNKLEHMFIDSGLAMQVNGRSSFSEIIKNIDFTISGLKHICDQFAQSDKRLQRDFVETITECGILPDMIADIPYYKNPFENRNFEYYNIGIPNFFNRIRIDLVHLEVIYLEFFIKIHGDDEEVQKRFETVKTKLIEYAKSAIHID